MPRELEQAVVALVHQIYGGKRLGTPEWLLRPGRAECRRRWPFFQKLYCELTDLELPEEMPPRESRNVDAVFQKRGQPPRILEFDETQHFNCYRALTLKRYPRSAGVAFPKRLWINRSEQKRRLEGGGFGRPKPPLFPGEGGRHRQRAYRDALADLLPLSHGWLPTLRIGDFEVKDWIYAPDARRRMKALLDDRIS